MTVYDLMIGDWIRTTEPCGGNNYICKVASLSANSALVEVEFLNGAIGTRMLSTLEPLKLTTELIEYNGWVKDGFDHGCLGIAYGFESLGRYSYGFDIWLNDDCFSVSIGGEEFQLKTIQDLRRMALMHGMESLPHNIQIPPNYEDK